MKPHGAPHPILDEPDPGLDDAFAAVRRLKRHIPHGRIMLVIETEDGLTVGHELACVRGTLRDTARCMSETPRKGRLL